MILLIVSVTALVSIIAFTNDQLFNRLMLNPYRVYHRKEWYRVLTHALLHGDWIHLLVNMLVLYSFGRGLVRVLHYYPNPLVNTTIYIGVLYVSAIVISCLTTIKKHKNNEWFNSVGASGGVSALVFTYIFFDPWQKLYLFAILPIPGIVFGVLYLVYSQYMRRKAGDNINHDAHFIGAVYGFIFPIILKPDMITVFIQQIANPNL